MPRLERRKTWYDGVMTLEKAAMMRHLASEGANPLHLAMAFGVCYTTACRIAKGDVWQGRQCRECWRIILPVPGKRGDVCAECMKRRCAHCGLPKPESRKSNRCLACDRANFQGVVRRRGHCRECGEELPETRKNTLCAECSSEEQRFRKQFRNNAGKRCKKCDEPVPATPSWTRNLCRACAGTHDALRRALSRRYCGICGKIRKDDSKGALCPDCQRDDWRIRRRGTTVTPEEHVALQERKR